MPTCMFIDHVQTKKHFENRLNFFGMSCTERLYCIIIPPYANKVNCGMLLVKGKEKG